jgi:hypothetical protein
MRGVNKILVIDGLGGSRCVTEAITKVIVLRGKPSAKAEINASFK